VIGSVNGTDGHSYLWITMLPLVIVLAVLVLRACLGRASFLVWPDERQLLAGAACANLVIVSVAFLTKSGVVSARFEPDLPSPFAGLSITWESAAYSSQCRRRGDGQRSIRSKDEKGAYNPVDLDQDALSLISPQNLRLESPVADKRYRLVFAHNERLGICLICVETSSGAAICSSTRDGFDPGTPGQIECGQARNINGLAPGAIQLVNHESLEVTGSVRVISACGAVTRSPARDRLHAAAGTGGWDARNLQRRAPGTIHLVNHERVSSAGAVFVVPARRAASSSTT
jgi:hypothetical protein